MEPLRPLEVEIEKLQPAEFNSYIQALAALLAEGLGEDSAETEAYLNVGEDFVTHLGESSHLAKYLPNDGISYSVLKLYLDKKKESLLDHELSEFREKFLNTLDGEKINTLFEEREREANQQVQLVEDFNENMGKITTS